MTASGASGTSTTLEYLQCNVRVRGVSEITITVRGEMGKKKRDQKRAKRSGSCFFSPLLQSCQKRAKRSGGKKKGEKKGVMKRSQ